MEMFLGTGPSASRTPDSTYMVHVNDAKQKRKAQAEKASSEPTTTSDGKRSLSTWHAPDAYAAGIILWEILTLKTPWGDCTSISDIWCRVQRGERPPVSDAEAAAAPKGYVTLMQELWAQDPVARPTFAEALRRLRGMVPGGDG